MTEELAYQVKTEVFEGPFDLLLQAIDDGQIDIYQVSLSQITASYFEYWRVEEPSLLLAADFLYLAAYLIELKSRGILPAKEEVLGADDSLAVEESLLQHIQEYQVFKKLAQTLKQRKEVFSRFYGRHEGEVVESEVLLVDVNLRDLVVAFQRVYKEAAEREKVLLIEAEEVTLEDRLNEIRQLLDQCAGHLPFEQLFIRGTRLEVVVTFLAILELAKQCYLLIRQEGRFGNIVIVKIVEPAEQPVNERRDGSSAN